MIKTVIQNFDYGFAAALIVNRSKKHEIILGQNEEKYVSIQSSNFFFKNNFLF